MKGISPSPSGSYEDDVFTFNFVPDAGSSSVDTLDFGDLEITYRVVPAMASSVRDNDSGVGTLTSTGDQPSPTEPATVYLRITVPDINIEV